MDSKPKFFIITTIPLSLMFFKGQITMLKTTFDVRLISSPGELLENAARNEEAKMHAVLMSREIDFFNDTISFFKILKLLIRERPDIIHCNTPKASLLFLIAGFILRVPCRIYYIHGFKYHGAIGLKRKFLKVIEIITCFFASDIIAVSKGVQQEVASDLTNKEVKIIGNGSINGIDLSQFAVENYDKEQLKQNLGIGSSNYVFGFIGRLVGDKGINELVTAFVKLTANYDDITLLLVGPFEANLDPIKQETRQEIQNNKNILSVGFQEDVKPFLAAMNVFVFPSYREGFGMSLMEANAMNVPAISSNIIGCNEVIEEGINGFLIKSKDETALFNKMESCLLNKSVIEKMSLDCREVIQKKYSQDYVWANSLRTYKEIASNYFPNINFHD